MHGFGRNARPDEGMSELFGNLSLVGSSGRFVAVLTKRQLTLERYDGHGLRLDLATISRMRNLQVPILPNSVIPLGAIAAYLGINVIVPPLGHFVAAVGGLSALSYLAWKRSVLVIETNAGDRHMISGSESILLRLCLMVDRVRHGASIEEAKIGLENLERELPQFPAFTDAGGEIFQNKGLLAAPENPQKEFDLFDINQAPVSAPAIPIPTPSPPIAHAVSTPSIGPNPAPASAVGTGSTEPLFPWESQIQTEPELVETKQSAYERTWGREQPTWYDEREPNRIDNALSDATESMGLFGAGGIFDADPEPSPTPHTTTPTSYSPPTTPPTYARTEAPARHTQPTSYPAGGQYIDSTPAVQPNRPKSSSQMIKAAHSRFGAPNNPFHGSEMSLPAPTEEAVREECKPGLVRQARAQATLNSRARAQASLPEPANLEEYPGLSKIANSMANGRVQTKGRISARRSGGLLESVLNPAPRNLPSRTQSYANEYGDVDGVRASQTSRFQTNQHLRLRSDQDHQANVAGRIREMNQPSRNNSARDALSEVVSRVSRGEENEPIQLNNDTGDSLRFSQMRRTTSKNEPAHLRGIRRLD